MIRKGASIIFVNDMNQVLLFLRDNLPNIAYPGMWDVPGGHVEKDETPRQCIVREMNEEMELKLKEFHLFSVYEFMDRIEYAFWKKANLNIKSITLHEGQCLKWFSREEVIKTKLACGFNEILQDFFRSEPFS